ncbi:MAG: hypothetical protein LBK56_14350 [Gracilibacteraceae bacterium]|jgi:hypothetical protein|nr:hypothetical protein [Gracilibacteraceae bacterium]
MKRKNIALLLLTIAIIAAAALVFHEIAAARKPQEINPLSDGTIPQGTTYYVLDGTILGARFGENWYGAESSHPFQLNSVLAQSSYSLYKRGEYVGVSDTATLFPLWGQDIPSELALIGNVREIVSTEFEAYAGHPPLPEESTPVLDLKIPLRGEISKDISSEYSVFFSSPAAYDLAVSGSADAAFAGDIIWQGAAANDLDAIKKLLPNPMDLFVRETVEIKSPERKAETLIFAASPEDYFAAVFLKTSENYQMLEDWQADDIKLLGVYDLEQDGDYEVCVQISYNDSGAYFIANTAHSSWNVLLRSPFGV